MDDQTRIELEAAAFRRLRQHLQTDRPEVQNIDMTMCHMQNRSLIANSHVKFTDALKEACFSQIKKT